MPGNAVAAARFPTPEAIQQQPPQRAACAPQQSGLHRPGNALNATGAGLFVAGPPSSNIARPQAPPIQQAPGCAVGTGHSSRALAAGSSRAAQSALPALSDGAGAPRQFSSNATPIAAFNGTSKHSSEPPSASGRTDCTTSAVVGNATHSSAAAATSTAAAAAITVAVAASSTAAGTARGALSTGTDVAGPPIGLSAERQAECRTFEALYPSTSRSVPRRMPPTPRCGTRPG